MADAKDCALLQAQFDSASFDAGQQVPPTSAQRMSDLMEYIERKQEQAGCR